MRIMGSGGLGFNFWANVLIYPGGRARAERTPHLLKAQAEVTDLTGLWHWEGAHIAFRSDSRKVRRRRIKQQKISIIMTVKTTGSYFVLVALLIPKGK